MRIFFAVLGFGLIWIVLWDAFETIVLPRRVTRKFRLTRLFYRSSWIPWSATVRRLFQGKTREPYLSFYGPLSLLMLIIVWAVGLVFGFALLHASLGSAINPPQSNHGFPTDLYLSGTTLFTLGMGDVTPATPLARALTVIEAGMGFGFLAIVIGYLPVIYQSFSRREVNISLLDARAGSPPTAAELLRRHTHDHGMEALAELLREWERWSADLLESHLSYPVLAYFRSQHNNQSWLAALTTILDTSALTIVGIEGSCQRQAELTFAMARHAVVDLAQIFSTPPRDLQFDRLPPDELRRLIPACAQGRYNCQTDQGWRKFVTDQGFTEDELRERWRTRLELLAFIEARFRAGIRISKEEMHDYYTTTLLPQLQKNNVKPPSEESIEPRIEEILLQQRGGALLSDGLQGMREEGTVHILDPTIANRSSKEEMTRPEARPQ